MTPSAPTTDVSGLALSVWKLGAIVGNQRIRVKTPGSGGQVARFSASATIAFRDVYAGNYFVCAISTNDRAFCWGFGEDGQLGNTSIITRNAPTWPVTPIDSILGPYTTFRSLGAGKSHVCGVAISQRVFCWGVNSDGRQFMLPPSLPSAKATEVTTPSFPANVQLASTRSVDAGESFSCVLTLGGIAMCSGNNENGQIGFGTVTPLLGTSQVDTSAGHPLRYSSVVTGERHACAMPRPPIPQTPWCWGSNSNGQLGDGTILDSSSPVQDCPAGSASPASIRHSVVTGRTTLPVATGAHAGSAFCWGGNAFGQLGDLADVVGNGPHPVPSSSRRTRVSLNLRGLVPHVRA